MISIVFDLYVLSSIKQVGLQNASSSWFIWLHPLRCRLTGSSSPWKPAVRSTGLIEFRFNIFGKKILLSNAVHFMLQHTEGPHKNVDCPSVNDAKMDNWFKMEQPDFLVVKVCVSHLWLSSNLRDEFGNAIHIFVAAYSFSHVHMRLITTASL